MNHDLQKMLSSTTVFHIVSFMWHRRLSKGAENSALLPKEYISFYNIEKTAILMCNNILQYYCFYVIINQIKQPWWA